jgi:hypothetical protein
MNPVSPGLVEAAFSEEFYHRRGEERNGERLRGRPGRSGIRDRHDVEILLGNQLALHHEAEFITAGCRKDEQRDIDAEIRDLETVMDFDIGKTGTTDELFRVEIDQVDIKVIETFGVGEAEVESHMLMLERKRSRLQMSEDSDQAFLFGEAIFNNLVAHEKRLDRRLGDIHDVAILEKQRGRGNEVVDACGNTLAGANLPRDTEVGVGA